MTPARCMATMARRWRTVTTIPVSFISSAESMKQSLTGWRPGGREKERKETTRDFPD